MVPTTVISLAIKRTRITLVDGVISDKGMAVVTRLEINFVVSHGASLKVAPLSIIHFLLLPSFGTSNTR